MIGGIKLDKILGINSNLFGLVAVGGFLIGFMSMPLWAASAESTVKKADCGCADCKGCKDKKEWESEMTEDVHAAPEGELARLNPTIVEGAEDIMGAENIVGSQSGCIYMQPWNDLTPQIAGPYYNPVSVVPTNGMPTNPSYYDGSYASAHTPTGFTYYDVANDERPQYQFPDYYTANYNPLDSWRPADKQIYNNSAV